MLRSVLMRSQRFPAVPPTLTLTLTPALTRALVRSHGL